MVESTDREITDHYYNKLILRHQSHLHLLTPKTEITIAKSQTVNVIQISKAYINGLTYLSFIEQEVQGYKTCKRTMWSASYDYQKPTPLG